MAPPPPEPGRRGVSIDDEEAQRDLAALNERFPMRNHVPPPQLHSNPSFRRHSHDVTGLRPAARRSRDAARGPRASHQYELQPIPSRGVLTTQRSPGLTATSSEEEDIKAPAAAQWGAAGGWMDGDHSVRENIEAFFSRRRAERRRKRFGGGSWRDKLRDRTSLLWRRIIIQGLLRKKPLPSSRDGRHIPLNPPDVSAQGLIDERSSKPYISNFIRSSRYTVWDFVPAQLIYQFSKLGNFYFLVMGILQMIPGLSTVGQYTTIGPLAFFIVVSMAKEGYDDYRRYLLDVAENRSLVWISRGGIREGKEKPARTVKGRDMIKKARGLRKEKDHALYTEPEDFIEDEDWMDVEWQQLKVGDTVRLKRDEAVPADMVLLHATGPNGVAYIETMALDGETNLKSKQACALLAERCNTKEGLRSTKAVIVSEDPNLDLYSYEGRVTVDGSTLPLSLNNVVYRGSVLRNTSEAIGLVINTGEECKIRMNANKNVKAKKPAMQSIINNMVLLQIFVVLMLAAGFTIGYALWEDRTGKMSWYIRELPLYDASVPMRQIFFGFLIMFNTLIPLSLYISMEIIKVGQLLLLQDAEMYDPVSDTPMVANTTTLLENLGQVSYVFSDKTGTLTENVMRFRKLSVAGVAALHDTDVQRDEDDKQKKIQAVQDSKKGKERAIPEPFSVKPLQRGNTQDDLHSFNVPSRKGSVASTTRWRSSVLQPGATELKTEDILDYVKRKPNTPFSKKAKHFLLCIALCHTCLPEHKPDGDIEYQAASPDELALVEAARDLGFLLIDRPAQTVKLQTTDAAGNPHVESYEVLDVIEFSSNRKRMSIIIKMPDGRICVFCKGADNVIMARLRLNTLAEQKAQDAVRSSYARKTMEQERERGRKSTQLSGYHNTPRNSMALSRRDSARFSLSKRSTEANRLSQAEAITSWVQRRNTTEMNTPRQSTDVLRGTQRQSLVHMPSMETIDRRLDESMAADEAAIFERTFKHTDSFASEGLRTLLFGYRYMDEQAYAQWKATYREAETSLTDRQQRIEEAAELIEQKFELAGATAIEDKLQEGVPETIEKLRRAKIKVWMLTGDKRETAINIGHSAHVCKPFSEIYVLDQAKGSLQDKMTTTLNEVGRGMVPHSVVVVDGATLTTIDADENLAILFYDLVIRVDSVICCRASPSQKSSLVRSIRRYVPKSMTLAIGDGANDVGMIQASHVGIGISGREGLQAARISDYSIAQFRFLQKLLFVHGRWNYLRTGRYVLATFWKEMLFFLVQALFQRYTAYTGTSLFDSASLTVFNTLFTSLPVILMGIFEQDLKAETLLEVPELYTFGQDNLGFSYVQYFGWMIMAAIGSVINFYFMYNTYVDAVYIVDNSLYGIGVVCFTASVIFINLKILVLDLHTKTIITMVGLFLSIGGWFLWMLLLAGLYSQSMNQYLIRRGFLDNYGHQLLWWANVGVNLVTLVVLELAVQAIRRVYWPTDQDLMQRIERDVYKKDKYRPNESGDAEEGDLGDGVTEAREGVKISQLVFTAQQDEPVLSRTSAAKDRLSKFLHRGQASSSTAPTTEGATATSRGRPPLRVGTTSASRFQARSRSPRPSFQEMPLSPVSGPRKSLGTGKFPPVEEAEIPLDGESSRVSSR